MSTIQNILKGILLSRAIHRELISSTGFKSAKALFFIFLFFNVQLSYSNTPFDTIYTMAEDERICDIIEFPNFYILTGDVINSNYCSSYVVKIGKNGTLLQDTLFSPGSMSHSIVKSGNDIVLIRANQPDSTHSAFIAFTIMDTLLNILFEKQLFLPDSLYISNYSVISNDGNFIIAGTTNSLPFPPIDGDPFLYIASAIGDSVGNFMMNNPLSNIDVCDGVAIKENRFFMFINQFGGTILSSAMLILDSNLSIIDTVGINNDLQHKFSPNIIEDSLFVICTTNGYLEKLFISKIDETGQIQKSVHFEKNNSAIFPSYQNSISIKDKEIFFLAIADFCFISPFVGYGKPSSLLVGKLDYNLNTKWLQYYGGDKYYHAFNIKATSDGGCICIGTVNDTINHNNKRDIFVLKLDSNGLVSWDQTIEIPKVNINVFPNPSNDKVNINISDFDFQDAIIEIYNVKGTKIHSIEHMSSNLEIDVVGWSPGIYLGRIIIEGKRFTTFKFVVY